MAAYGLERSSAMPTSRTIATSRDAFRRWPRRCCPAHRRSFGTLPRSAAISYSERAAHISTTSRVPAINANPVRVVTPAVATTGFTPSWGGVRAASRHTRLTSACPLSRSTPLSKSKAKPDGGKFRSKCFTDAWRLAGTGESSGIWRDYCRGAVTSRGAAFCSPCSLSKSSRTHLIRVCSRISRCGSTRRRCNDRGSTSRARRRCHETLAGPQCGSDPDRRTG